MRLLSFHRAARMLTLIAAAAAVFVTAAGAAPRVQRDRATVIGYASKHALREAVADSGGRVVRMLPALHAAEVQAPPAALRLMSGLPGIRYAQRPVARSSLAEPALAPAAVPGGMSGSTPRAARISSRRAFSRRPARSRSPSSTQEPT
jgi:hypothetical protein